MLLSTQATWGNIRTYHNVQRMCWWPGMSVDIKVRKRLHNMASIQPPAAKLMPIPIPQARRMESCQF